MRSFQHPSTFDPVPDRIVRLLARVDRAAGAESRHADGPAAFRIADIRRAVPGVSDQTIRLVFASLKAAGLIDVDSTGRSAIWHRR
jgi:hypothetical protein